MQADCLVIDSRPATTFTGSFIPGSISLGLEGRLTDWASRLLPADSCLLLVTEEGREADTMRRLKKAGFLRIEGVLDGGMAAWIAAGLETDLIIEVEADELAMDLPFDRNLVLVDVRTETEFDEGHLEQAVHVSLEDFSDPAMMARFEDKMNLYIQSGSGYRSVIAASLLKRQGIHNLRNIWGGFAAIRELESRFNIVKEGRLLN